MAEPGAAADPALAADTKPETRDSSGLVLGVIAMVLLIVGGGWLYLSFGTPEAPVAPDPVTASPAPAPEPLEIPEQIDPRFDLAQNLDMGQLALDAGQLVEPPDGSALYFFLSAREQSPGNVVADAGLLRIANEMAERGQAQLGGEEFAAFADTLRVIERIDPENPDLERLRAEQAAVIEQKLAAIDGATRRGQWVPAQALLDQLALIPDIDQLLLIERTDALQTAQAQAEQEAATQAAAAAAAAQAAATEDDDAEPAEADEDGEAAAQPEVPDTTSLLAAMVDRIDRGDLLTPPGANAREAFNELARAAPGDPSVEVARTRLVGALAERSVALGSVEQFAEAGRTLDAAELLAPGSPRIATARDTVLAQRVSVESQRLVPVGEMVRTRSASPRYPRTALRNGAQGFVLLNFTVLRDGTTTAVEVVETSEDYSALFSRSAVAAVAQWEFQPREFQGQVIEQRVQARLMFEIED